MKIPLLKNQLINQLIFFNNLKGILDLSACLSIIYLKIDQNEHLNPHLFIKYSNAGYKIGPVKDFLYKIFINLRSRSFDSKRK